MSCSLDALYAVPLLIDETNRERRDARTRDLGLCMLNPMRSSTARSRCADVVMVSSAKAALCGLFGLHVWVRFMFGRRPHIPPCLQGS